MKVFRNLLKEGYRSRPSSKTPPFRAGRGSSRSDAYVKNLLKRLFELRPELREVEERIPLIQVFINGVEAVSPSM